MSPAALYSRAMELNSPLARVLRDGPFEAALSAAVDRSGLTLDRIREHLASRGVRISRATLVYWRQGRSRPEREASLEAVAALEQVLGLPRASLLALLGPRRPRGRWAGHTPGTLPHSTVWPPVTQIMQRLAAPAEGDLLVRSVHDVLTLGPERCERVLRVRKVVESAVDRAFRLISYYQIDDPERDAPRLGRVWYGRAGRAEVARRYGLMAAEILLDQPLGRGDRTMVEYELCFPPGRPLLFYQRWFTRPTAEYALVVDFGAQPPARCHRITQRSPGAPERAESEVWVGAGGVVQSIATDVPAGAVGLRWQWD